MLLLASCVTLGKLLASLVSMIPMTKKKNRDSNVYLWILTQNACNADTEHGRVSTEEREVVIVNNNKTLSTAPGIEQSGT